MAYVFSCNNLPLTSAKAMWILISTMVSAGWVVKADSDGTTYAAAGGQVTHGGTGAGGLGNTKAWVRIQAPTTTGGATPQAREFTIQRGTAYDEWRIKYSSLAKFTGGAPGILVTPSSTDEVFLGGGGTDAVPTWGSLFPTDNTYKFHVASGGAAEFYSFYCFAQRTDVLMWTGFSLFLDVMSAGSYPSADVDPAVVQCSATWGAQATFASLGGAMSNVTNPCEARAWLGATSAAGAATVGTNNQRVAMIPYGSSSGNVMGGVGQPGSNPWTKEDDLLPAWWMRSGLSTAPNGIKGCSTLFLYGSVQKMSMTTADYSAVGAKDLCCSASSAGVGAPTQTIWFPWNGSSPLI